MSGYYNGWIFLQIHSICQNLPAYQLFSLLSSQSIIVNFLAFSYRIELKLKLNASSRPSLTQLDRKFVIFANHWRNKNFIWLASKTETCRCFNCGATLVATTIKNGSFWILSPFNWKNKRKTQFILYIALLGDGGLCHRERQRNVVNNMLEKKNGHLKS